MNNYTSTPLWVLSLAVVCKQRFGGRPAGDTRKLGRSDLPRRSGEPGRIGEETKWARWGGPRTTSILLLTSRSTHPNHLRRDVGRAGVRAGFGDNAPKKVLRTLPGATDNSKKKLIVLWYTHGYVTHTKLKYYYGIKNAQVEND